MISKQLLCLLVTTIFICVNCCGLPKLSDDSVLYTCQDDQTSFELDTFKGGTSTFVEIITNKIYANATLPLRLVDLKMDQNIGDILIIGKGSYKEVFAGSPSMMYVETQEDSKDLEVPSANVTVVFIAQSNSTGSKERSFKIEWKKRIGEELQEKLTTPAPTVPTSEADRQAIILCFRRNPYHCKQFLEVDDNESKFRRRVADIANHYMEDQKIVLPSGRRIIHSDIKVSCEVVAGNKDDTVSNQTRENNYLIVKIMDRRNTDMPVFAFEQLREIFKTFNLGSGLIYEIAECRSYPNYWWWFWGSGVMLIFFIILFIIFWCWAKYEFWNEKDVKEQSEKPMEDHGKGQVNFGYVTDVDDKPVLRNGHISLGVREENPADIPEEYTPKIPYRSYINRQDSVAKLDVSASVEVNPYRSAHSAATTTITPPSPVVHTRVGENRRLPENTLYQKPIEEDTVSRKSDGFYEELDHFTPRSPATQNSLRPPPSPVISFRTNNSSGEEDTETEL